MSNDTVIIHDLQLERTYFGSTRAEALAQFTQLQVTQRPDGGWRVEVILPGFNLPLTLSYQSCFTHEEMLHEVSVDAVRAIARDYGVRYRVYYATAA